MRASPRSRAAGGRGAVLTRLLLAAALLRNLSRRVVGFSVTTPRLRAVAAAYMTAALLFLPGCALLRSPAEQNTTTTADGARVLVIVVSLWAPSIKGIDLSGPVSGATGGQSAEQSTDVDAKASGLPGLP